MMICLETLFLVFISMNCVKSIDYYDVYPSRPFVQQDNHRPQVPSYNSFRGVGVVNVLTEVQVYYGDTEKQVYRFDHSDAKRQTRCYCLLGVNCRHCIRVTIF